MQVARLQTQHKRAHGSGGLTIRGGAYFGKWRVDGRQVMRRIGPVRQAGTREGLTKAQAEARLRTLMAEMTVQYPQPRSG